MKKILIYRSRLLPVSETFVRQHYDSLDRYEPAFAGLRAVAGLPVADTRHVLLEDDKRTPLRIAAFMAAGWAPDFMGRIGAMRPDLIHAHFAVDAIDMLPVARRLGVPLVVTLHGYDVTCRPGALRRMGPQGWNYLARRQLLFQRADLFLPVSEHIGQKALDLGVPAGRMRVHQLGIDLARFRPDGPRERTRTVLFVGRLVEKKGLDILIEALARAGASENGIMLRVIGDGPRRSYYEALAKNRLRDFTFLGTQPHSTVIEELRKARVFCVPSIVARDGDAEGLPISHLEAQAMGVPVTGFAEGGVAEAVVHGETGLLAPAGDIDMLAAHIRALCEDDTLCERLGENGRRRVAALFDLKQRAGILQDHYDALLAARVPA